MRYANCLLLCIIVGCSQSSADKSVVIQEIQRNHANVTYTMWWPSIAVENSGYERLFAEADAEYRADTGGHKSIAYLTEIPQKRVFIENEKPERMLRVIYRDGTKRIDEIYLLKGGKVVSRWDEPKAPLMAHLDWLARTFPL